ncbi:MAG: hypothetical protein ACI4QI_07875 [Candidatus Coproplasma sp.]
MSKRKYNHNAYKIISKGGKVVRDKFAPDPLEEVKNTGITGKAIGEVGDSLLEKPIHKASYAMAGLSYDKEKDNPCKGSVTYTAWYMGIKRALKFIVGCILSSSVLAGFVAFLRADLLTQAKITLGMVPLALIIIAVVKFIKKFFK